MRILAGNGTRTRDILLGKKSVMLPGEPISTDDWYFWEEPPRPGDPDYEIDSDDEVVE